MTDRTITLLFTRRFGSMDRIMSILRRRGFPISGMTLERTQLEDVGRMTITVAAEAVEQVSRHLRKLPDVLEVGQADHTLRREYALARVRCSHDQRGELQAVLAAFDARPIGEGDNHLVVEATGPSERLDVLFAALDEFGIEELARTSPVALTASQT